MNADSDCMNADCDGVNVDSNGDGMSGVEPSHPVSSCYPLGSDSHPGIRSPGVIPFEGWIMD